MKWHAISQLEIEWWRARTSSGSRQLGGSLRSLASPSIEDLSSAMKRGFERVLECNSTHCQASSTLGQPGHPPCTGAGGWPWLRFRSKEKKQPSFFLANFVVLHAPVCKTLEPPKN